jgi:hypothetical protein
MGLIRQPNLPLAALAWLTAAFLHPADLKAQQWELAQPQNRAENSQHFQTIPAPSQPSKPLQWSVLPSQQPADTTITPSTASNTTAEAEPVGSDGKTSTEGLHWQPLTATEIEERQEAIQAEIQEAQELIKNPRIIFPASGPTYANFRALWRDGDWLPQISSLVPVGFGPKGFMLSLYARGIDCSTGKGECPGFTTYSAWQDSINQLGSGQVEQVIGFGDPIKAFSASLNNSSEKVAAQLKNGTIDTSTLLTGNQTGVAIAKAFGPDTSIRTGIDNLIRWDSNNSFYDPLSFYAVVSQRIRMNDNRSPWFSSAYITAGIGNGDFRPIEQIFIAQTEALRQAGCATYGYTPKKPCSQNTFNRAIQSGSNYGQINPIGSIGLEIYNGINLITEWTGRNMNLGFSWRPFPGLGLVITPMMQSLIQNCEYPGCKVNVPNYNERVPLPSSVLTQRARLSLQASLEFKF